MLTIVRVLAYVNSGEAILINQQMSSVQNASSLNTPWFLVPDSPQGL